MSSSTGGNSFKGVQVDHHILTAATRCEVMCDLNSNSVSKLSVALSDFPTDKSHADTEDIQIISGNADTGVGLANYTPESPASDCRELADIRSPSPIPVDMLAGDRSEEIRSPSPCSVESPAELFHVVETSWDVKLSSPYEIQSPDISDDEVDNSPKQFHSECIVCLHHGPITIPLTIEEAMQQKNL